MKKLTAPAVILILTAMSCGRGGSNLDPYGWERVDPVFDSLTLEAERHFLLNSPRDSMARVVAAMERRAAALPDNSVVDARTTFFKGQLVYTYDDSQAGDSLKRKSLLMTDSARYPYDAARISYFLDNEYHEPSVEYYCQMRDWLSVFRHSGDKLWSGALAMDMGMFLGDLGDTHTGEEYLDMADSLLLAGGFHDQLAANRINRANLLLARRDSTSADSLMRVILGDTVNPISPMARHIVLGNLYSLTGDTLALHKAYSDVSHFTNSTEFVCLYASCLADEKLRAGQRDSALYYRRVAATNLDETANADAKLRFYNVSHRLFKATGMPDSAYYYLSNENDLRRRIADEVERAEINHVTLYSKIEKMRIQADLEKRRVEIVALCIIFCVMVGATLVAWLFYRRTQRQKLARMEATIARERSERKALAMETVLQEKENMIHDVEREMSELTESGELSGSVARKLGTSMKLHLSQQEQRDSFLETAGNLSADFSRRLREEYPTLTEADMRLASYIAIGMDSKHIARVMSIRPESVKQARWRLRGKLGLATGESLDDLLRGFASRQ